MTITVTVKKNDLGAWFRTAKKAANKVCARSRPPGRVKVTVKRGMVRAGYDFNCVEGVAT